MTEESRGPLLSFDDWYRQEHQSSWPAVAYTYGVADALREFINRQREYLAYMAEYINSK